MEGVLWSDTTPSSIQYSELNHYSVLMTQASSAEEIGRKSIHGSPWLYPWKPENISCLCKRARLYLHNPLAIVEGVRGVVQVMWTPFSSRVHCKHTFTTVFDSAGIKSR